MKGSFEGSSMKVSTGFRVLSLGFRASVRVLYKPLDSFKDSFKISFRGDVAARSLQCASLIQAGTTKNGCI